MLISAGVLLVFIPVLQALSQIWPLQLNNIQWRFQVANVLSSVLLLPYLGLQLIAVTARRSGGRGIERVIGVVALLSSLVLLASIAVFVLDALQLKTIVQSRAMEGFQLTVGRVVLVVVVFFVAFLLMGIALLRGKKKDTDSNKSRAKATEESVLIVGRN